MKISKEQLNKISEMAKYYYRNDSNPELNPDQLVSAAWTKAVMSVLQSEMQLDFPSRNLSESVFED
jgi:predicted lipoprotein